MKTRTNGCGEKEYAVKYPTAPTPYDYWSTSADLKPVRNWRRIRTKWIRDEIEKLIAKAKEIQANAVDTHQKTKG